MCALEKMYEAILMKHGKLVVSPECFGYKSEKILYKDQKVIQDKILYNPYSKKVVKRWQEK
jgi:hypothetical protein